MIDINVRTLQEMLSCTRRAVDDYTMISPGDRIAVGVSGGKDSLALLSLLCSLKRFYPIPFEVIAIHLQMGFPGADSSNIRELCNVLGVELYEEKTDIYEVVFNVRKEDSPCSLCANLRRGILYSKAKELNCNKIALGHHFDDAVETLMMNLFIEGRFGCFSPVTELSRMQVTMIRPMIYIEESTIKRFIKASGITPSPKLCPADGNTKREEAKRFLAQMEKKDPGVKQRLFGAMERAEINGFSVHPRGRKTYTKKGNEEE